MQALGRTVAWSGLALAIVGGATVVFGQGRGEPGDGSMAALTAEVRELRMAVQQLAQTQSQTQALGVYLSVQQSRVLQVSSHEKSSTPRPSRPTSWPRNWPTSTSSCRGCPIHPSVTPSRAPAARCAVNTAC
jgi:hypothetical protein